MKAVRTVETASVVDPKTRVSIRVQTSSRISPEAPERKKQASTKARIGAPPFIAVDPELSNERATGIA